MDTWNASTWWGLAFTVYILLGAVPLLIRQATDQQIEKKYPHIPHQRERAKTDKLSWLWIAGGVILMVLWSIFK